MSPRRLLTMLLSVGLLGLPMLLLGAGPASATDYNSASQIILANPGTRIYKQLLTVKGQLIADDGAGETGYVPGATVVLSRQWKGSTTWTELGSATTSDTDGTFAFSQTATQNAVYKVTYAGETFPQSNGDNYILAGSEASTNVGVMRDLGARDPKDGAKIIYKGNVNPGYGKSVIYLQRKKCKTCGWKLYDKGRTGTDGSWAFNTPAPRTGSWWWRTKIPGDTKFVTGYSAILRTYRL